MLANTILHDLDRGRGDPFTFSAVDHRIQILEASGSMKVTSVAEHVVMPILRNFVPAHEMIERGERNVAEIARIPWHRENWIFATLQTFRLQGAFVLWL